MDFVKILKEFNITVADDIVVENQRGFTIVDYTLYSPHLLIPKIDPPQYQIVYYERDNSGLKDMTKIKFTTLSKKILHSFEQFYPMDFQPDHVTPEDYKWYILVSIKDTDDDGWNYSWFFRHKRWKYKNGFVRRRIWVKLPDMD
ncbi:hypothetical protein C6P45_000172 [Maudiozyma exigua]|uniref:Peroxin/Ferlin domain-containing protein n=1 Tax=Maudiozyma exigua TaxID=34358 RepID=A0A9P6W7Q7_MAUEX|nr:hypothetical protein C6P45_000172 [Kazachstania exigua]